MKTDKLQALLDRLNDSVALFEMRFPPPNCKMLLHDWADSKPNLAFGLEEPRKVDKFCNSCNYITPSGHLLNEVSS